MQPRQGLPGAYPQTLETAQQEEVSPPDSLTGAEQVLLQG